MYVGPVLVDSGDGGVDVGVNYAYVGSLGLTVQLNSPTVGPLPPTNVYVGSLGLQITLNSPTQGPLAPVSPSSLVLSFDPATANLNAVIADVVVEDDYDIVRSILGVPVGAVLIEAWLTLKENESDLDADAILQKVITSSPQTGIGQITDIGTSGTGSLIFQLSAAETNLLVVGKIYPYDIQVKTDTGKYSTREKGRLIPIGQVTDSL